MLTNSNIKQGDCVKRTVPVTPIANERGAIYEFDSSGNKIQELKPTYDGSDTIVKYLLYE